MSRERALLRRLVEWYDEMPGYGSIGVIASDARALLAEPAPEEEDETANVDWERVYHPELYATPPAPECDDDIHDELCDCNQARPDRGGNVSDRVQVPFTAAQQQNIQRWQDRGDVHPLTCPVNSTHGDLVPRKDGLHCLACGAVQTWCPWFIAEGTFPLPCGKRITADPNALPSPVLRSRAEAEAMLKRYDESVVALQEGPMEALVPDAAEFDDARAALLAALTGEGT